MGPSSGPTRVTTRFPTPTPTMRPSGPTLVPTRIPTRAPSVVPSVIPSIAPSVTPTVVPTLDLSSKPTAPSAVPTARPTNTPVSGPFAPSVAPTFKPSRAPTLTPSATPTKVPTVRPTGPSFAPSTRPTTPTAVPTRRPTNGDPTAAPTIRPTFIPPTLRPSGPSIAPTASTQSPTAPVDATLVSFSFTGGMQEFNVPDGVYELIVTLVGASGASSMLGSRLAQGGRGAKITARVPVRPGDIFHLYVGGAGSGRVGGFNGGGNADGVYTFRSAGGGGGTDLRVFPFGVDDRVMVAGGGGGGGGDGSIFNCVSSRSTAGGDGGYPNGLESLRCLTSSNIQFRELLPATGGSQLQGGDFTRGTVSGGGPGSGDIATSATSLNQGSLFSGGTSIDRNVVSSFVYGGGGGGGGYYGGGGGFAMGGGGGSSYSAYPILETFNGTWIGDGSATIQYTPARPTGAPTYTPTGPSMKPTVAPTWAPSPTPPTVKPSAKPSAKPTFGPSYEQGSPTASPVPSAAPSIKPTARPSFTRTIAPTRNPSAPVLTVALASKTRSSITLTVTFSAATFSGTVYCAAFLNGATVTNSQVLTSGASATYLAGATSATVVIPGLQAVVDYDAYCVAATVGGVTSLETALSATKVDVQTSCCNVIAYSVAPSYIHGDLSKYTSASRPVFTYTLSAAPRTALTVTPVVRNASTNAIVASLNVLPSSIAFTSSSALVGQFVVSGSALLAGSVKIELQLSGTSAADFSGSDAASTTIMSSATQSPAPALLNAKFSDSGASITVTFDSATNRALITALSFPCSDLFDFVGITTTTCSWTSSTTVSVVFNTAPAGTQLVMVGGTLTLRGSMVKAVCIAPADCTSYEAAVQQSVVLLLPDAPVVPKVVLRVPSVISGCDDFPIDPSLSSGAGGRPWKAVTWEATMETATTGAVASGILGVLNSYGSVITTPISIPKALVSSARYTVSLTLTNFLDQRSSASAIFTTDDNPNLPATSILGPSVVTMVPSSGLTLFTSATRASCAISSSKITYTWAVTKNGVKQSIVSTSPSPTKFALPAYTLSTQSVYVVTFTATASASTNPDYPAIAASTSVTVQVGKGNVVASVAGGSYRSVSAAFTALTLDASGSYDESYPIGTTVAGQTLSFSWTCVINSAANYGASCADKLPIDRTSSTLVITTSGLLYGELYVFTVMAAAADGRSSFYEVTVQSSAGSTFTSIEDLTLTKVNPTKKLILTGAVQAGYAIDAYWEALVDGVPLTFSASTPLRSSFTSAQVLTSLAYPLSVPANTFAAGSTVAFRLSANFAGDDTKFTSYSTVPVVMNAPPTGGAVSVNPTAGEALSQVFTVTSFSWTDDATDFPLAYEFSYRLVATQSALTVQTKTASNVASMTLPAGQESQGNAIALISTVYDTFLASTTASTSAVVTAAANVDVSAYVSAQLASIASSGDSAALSQVIANAASSINTVDCSAANATFCAALNRNPCFATPQKCSACLDGYAGLSGDRNTKCRNDGAVLGVTGAACASNGDCAMGLCASNVCEVPILECPSATSDVCSGHGSCGYTDGNNNPYGRVCTITDPACTAKCTCSSGFGGAACTLSTTELLGRDSTRASLCAAVVSIGDGDDVSYVLLDSLISSLFSAYDPNEVVSAESRATCQQALTKLAAFSAAGYLSSESTTLIIDVAAKFVQGSGSSGRRRLASDDSGSAVDTAVSGIIAGILSSLANGEEPAVYANSQMELTVYKALTSNFTTLAASAGSENYVELTSSAASALQSDSGYIKASALRWLQSPFAKSSVLDAPLLRLELFDVAAPASRRTQEPEAEAAFYIVNSFSAQQNFNFSLTIEQAIAVGANNFTIPKCAHFVDGDFEECHGCWVSTYTNSNVTYACPLSALLDASATRRKLQSTTSQVTQFSTVVTEVEPLATPSGNSADFEINWGKQKIVLAFLSTLTFIILVGFAVFRILDVLEQRQPVASSAGATAGAAAAAVSSADGADPAYDQIYAPEKQTGTVSAAVPILTEYLDSVLIASDLQQEINPSWATFFIALLKHHKYTAVFFTPTQKFNRTLRWTSLTMSFLQNLFFVTVFFGVFYPDNGLCEDHHNIESCLKAENRVTNTNLCSWNIDETTGDGSCGINKPPRTFVYLIVIVMVVVVISIPFHVAYDYLLVNVCMRRPRFEDWGLTAASWMGRNAATKENDQTMLASSTARTLLVVTGYHPDSAHDGTLSVEAEAEQIRSRAGEQGLSLESSLTSAMPLTAARVQANTLVLKLNKNGAGDTKGKEILLLQHFILEQFSTFKQFVLRRHMFDFTPTSQTPAHPLLWLLAWFWVILSGAFFLAWAFAWAATHRGSSSADWGIVLGTALAQDLLVIQTFRAWVIYLLSMVSIRPQLQDIYRVLLSVAVAHTQDELGGNVANLRVCQHVSPACRAAHAEGVNSLAAATILRRMDDADVAACREKQHLRLSALSTAALALPVVFSWAGEVLGLVVLGALLPAFFDAFLIMNRYFYAGANLFILVPYLFALVLCVCWFLLIEPAFRKVEQQRIAKSENGTRKAAAAAAAQEGRLESLTAAYGEKESSV